ncbi:hypothetical protein MBSD_n2473 [Mizugakiibacter sediminis]|uniref:UPF0102 protein MBSD_1414 n=1 Tax=Mizugakiibacter sediminis TaxID=1475481 RepID=A0A0K8QRY8_9GAMM|nr:YraN family protein [Mizugakiibacter sediminis]GAP67157.1 hypothetical protein MBSD_n2473 [Mizugakiibacter sediminis]
MTRARGGVFEQHALDRLTQAGLALVARNFTTRHGELDLVMRDGDTLVFVEVRYRRGTGFGGGMASVDAAKRAKLVRAAALFLAAHPRLAHLPCRFDVVAFAGDAAQPTCDWRRAAFDAE